MSENVKDDKIIPQLSLEYTENIDIYFPLKLILKLQYDEKRKLRQIEENGSIQISVYFKQIIFVVCYVTVRFYISYIE